MFDVDPITTTTTSSSVSVAAARGGWRRHLQQDEEEGGGMQQHSTPFEAKLILEKSTDLYATSPGMEEVKQFFLNGLNNGGDTITELGSLLGDWSAVEFAPVATTDMVGAVAENESAGATAIPAVLPETATTAAVPNPSSSTATVSAESTSTTTPADESSGSNVLGIIFGVVGGCVVAFIFIAFVHRHRRKNRAVSRLFPNNGGVVGMTATAASETSDVDHIGDVNACDIENNEKQQPKELKDIDKVLADLQVSDDSSFISSNSSAEDTSCYSGYSGLTGISDLNYQPKNTKEAEDASKLEKVEEVKPSISFLDQSKGGLLMRDTSLKRKEESFGSDPSDSKGSSTMGTSQSTRKEESFESDYRDKSAMATLNLKKDMLNADVGGDEKARTLTAQQNSEMMASQRQVDKVRAAKVKAKKRMKSVSPSKKDVARSLSPNRDVIVEPDESRDRLLPSPIEKSDDDVSLEIV